MKEEIFYNYVDAICEHLDIDRESLFKKSIGAKVAEARHLLYYICWIRPITPATITRLMNENGYKTWQSAIKYGIEKMERLVEADPDYYNLVKKIA